MTLVQTTRTRLSEPEAFSALRDAYAVVVGESARNDTIAILAAQSALETGRWQSMFNWNFGNITSTGAGDYFELTQTPGYKYVSWPTRFAGAEGFVRYLQRKWNTALSAAKTGDVNAYVKALRVGEPGGYAEGKPGHPEEYENSVIQLFQEFRGTPPATPLAEPAGPSASPSSSAHWVMLSTSLLRSCDDTRKLATLRLKDQGADVLYLRSLLGLPHSIHFDSACATRVRDFQKGQGLSPDMIVGPKTWAALRKVVGGA